MLKPKITRVAYERLRLVDSEERFNCFTPQELADALDEAGVELPEPSKPKLQVGDIVRYMGVEDDPGWHRKVMAIDEKRFLLSEAGNFAIMGSTRLLSDFPNDWVIVGHDNFGKLTDEEKRALGFH